MLVITYARMPREDSCVILRKSRRDEAVLMVEGMRADVTCKASLEHPLYLIRSGC